MLAPYAVGKRPERLDRIARALYGSEHGGVVEGLLAANPGLALQGPFIAPGTVIAVPAPPPTPKPTVVLPWQ